MASTEEEDNVYADLIRPPVSGNPSAVSDMATRTTFSPPPLLPKQGTNSFRQTSAVLDRQHFSISPKPIPRVRKQSSDPHSDADSPLSDASCKRISRSCEFSPPTLVGPQVESPSVRIPSRGSSSLASSTSFNDGMIPSDENTKKPATKTNSLGPVSRPVPVPRTRTVFMTRTVEAGVKDNENVDKQSCVENPDTAAKEPQEFDPPIKPTDVQVPLMTELDNKNEMQNDESDEIFKDLEQVTNIDEPDHPVQQVTSNENENYVDDNDVFKNNEEPGNLPTSTTPSLPSTPKAPSRQRKVQNSVQTPTVEDEQSSNEVMDPEFLWNNSTTNDETNASKNSDTDFFSFDAFNVSPMSAVSNDPWPGVSNTSFSSTSDSKPTSNTSNDGATLETFDGHSHNPNIPFDDVFKSSLPATKPPAHSTPFIDLGDFDPLSTNSKSDSNQALDANNDNSNEYDINLSLDTKVSLFKDSSLSATPETSSLGTYVDLSSRVNNSTTTPEDVYSLAYNTQLPVPPKPTRPISHAPSFHFNPPTAPPPPFPRFETLQDSELVPPPVPPRPTAVGNLNKPLLRNSNILEDLSTSEFSPMPDNTDPFQDTDFGEECYTFNKTLGLNGQPSSQASEFCMTPSPVAAAAGGYEGSNVTTREREPSEAGAAQDPCQDPDRISQFVIPAPCSSGSNTPVIRPKKEISSSDSESVDGAAAFSTGRPRWTSGGQPVAGLTILDSGQLAPKKNQRYGYLYKQGGYNANKGWKKRWVVFNGTSLSYYDNNTSQVSKRIIPVACMKEVISDVKTNERHSFKFKVVTTLQDRVFIFSAESLEDCVLWSNNIMAGITEFKKAKMDSRTPGEAISDKEGFIKFNNMKKYYVVINGHHLRYFRSYKDFQMGSPIHEIDMKLASVKVKDRRRSRLQLWLNYDHFELSFENDSDMQSWRMAMEDAIAEGLADDTVLEKVYHNISNRECADCSADKPHWASINLGIVVCKNCAGIHRMFDYHISKIRSLRMDTRVWTPSLIELMVTIGNANANAFWEYSLQPEVKLLPSCSIVERKDFIHKKYFNKKFRNHHPLTGMSQALGEELHKSASKDNVLETMKILFSGADVLFRKDGCEERAYDIAKGAGQRLIMELLYQNCGDSQAVVEDEEDENRLREDIRLQGYLNKAGPAGRTYDKRWCIIEHGALNYYFNDKSLTSKGNIDRRNMLLIQEVTSKTLDRAGFYFEISSNTKENRVFSFSTDSKDEACEWIRTLAKLIAPVAVMEHVGMIDIKFAGYAHVRESIGNEWKQSFLVFTWRGLYYMNKDLRFDYIDLRKASSIKLQDSGSGYHLAAEKGPCFIISSTGKSLYLQAPLPRDTERMFNALLYAVKGSGRSLIDQALTNENVPVIIDKCVTHISKLGLEEKGIYRLSGQTSRIQALLEEFRKDAGAVVLESYTLHEVANVLKRFLRELEDSVFERINYSQWTGMAASRDVNNRLMWYKYYLEKMPSVNYSTLKRLILHLSQIALYATANQMNILNLATCFAPSLLRTEMDAPNLMSDVSSREINILVDLISYQDYFFEDKENERKINDNIRRAEQLIMQKMQETREGTMSSSNMEKILTPVYMINADGPAVNILVTDDTKAQQALDYFKRSKATSDIDTSSFALYELVSKGQLVRPLFPDESMAPTVKRWLEWEDWVKEDNSVSLCARSMELLEQLDANYNPTHILLSKLQYCDSKGKKFKRYTVGFRQCRLAVYTNPKAIIEVSSWNVEDLTFYIGSVPKKSSPTKHCLTFIVNGEKCSKNVGMFGHCLCFDTEDELYRWASALYVAQHPCGFLTWNS